MDPRHTGEILRHLENQQKLLTEAYTSMSHELHQLQVEEEILMRNFYEIMLKHHRAKENMDDTNVSDANNDSGHSTADCVGDKRDQ